jgi:methyl-accepting chemotaxis protein
MIIKKGGAWQPRFELFLRNMADCLLLTIKSRSAEMLAGSEQIGAEGKTLETITADMMSGMNEIASRMDVMNAAIARVQDITHKNKDSIDVLTHAVDRFRV